MENELDIKVTGSFELATEEYESLVKACADGDMALEIPNRHIAHAAILTKHIIRRTELCVDILTGSMPELFFVEIFHALKTSLQKNIQARILFVNKATPCSGLRDLAAQHPHLKIYEIKDEVRDKVKEGFSHFCVSDNKRFRIEEIHPDKDFSKDPAIKAIASFNHPAEARSLHDLFSELIAFSNPVKL